MVALEVQDISKTYGFEETAVVAIKDVSLRVERGQIVLLIGPSGSGKTTLLLVCGTLLRPDTGRVLIDGIDITFATESQLSETRLKKIGFVFQQFNLLARLTAQENVELVFNLSGLRRRQARDKAREALESVGLGNRLRHLPEELSVGEKQRVALARALANNPLLLIADEPTANLDSKRGTEVVQLMREKVRDLKIGALIASHDQRITGFADVVFEVRDGRLSEAGSDFLHGK